MQQSFSYLLILTWLNYIKFIVWCVFLKDPHCTSKREALLLFVKISYWWQKFCYILAEEYFQSIPLICSLHSWYFGSRTRLQILQTGFMAEQSSTFPFDKLYTKTLSLWKLLQNVYLSMQTALQSQAIQQYKTKYQSKCSPRKVIRNLE